MNRTPSALVIALCLLLVSLPIVLLSGGVFAQTTGYNITRVDHNVTVLYTGHVIIQDIVYVSGQVSGDFMIGMPFSYSSDFLKVSAYDSNHVFQVTLGVPLGNQGGFYGAEVNFNGAQPSVFTVAFVLSNNLLTFNNDTNAYSLDFPAYPSLTQSVATCNVAITLPIVPTSITITKSGGTVNSQTYTTQNLPAYTNNPASAVIQVIPGTIQLSDISHLNRQITVNPAGKVTASDSYTIINQQISIMSNFVLELPANATAAVIKDSAGTALATSYTKSSDLLLANTTLSTQPGNGESTVLIASYDLPSTTIVGSKYTLDNVELFPDYVFYVDQATFTFNPPEGASIVTPQLSFLNPSSSLTRSTFQDSLTIMGDGLSFLDSSLPGNNNAPLSFNYNPVWASFLPTLWVSLAAVIGCIGAVVYKKRGPSEKAPARKERLSTQKPAATTTIGAKSAESMGGQRFTPENIKEFTEAYDDKKRLNAEIRSLDARAQKGKMPRRQYKVQRRAIEIRLETIDRNTTRLKDVLRGQSGYSDLIKQLDSAEADLDEANDNVKNLESQQNKGEISIESYKKDIADAQKRRDKAESTISGILLRLREKAH